MSATINKIFNALRLFRSAFGEYKWQIVILTILISVSGFLEGIGLNAVIPLFSLMDKNQPEANDIISKVIKKFFLFIHLSPTVKYLLIFITTLFITKAVFSFISKLIMIRIIANYERKMKGELLRLMFQSDWPYLSKQKIGHLDRVLIDNVRDGSKFFDRFSSAILVAVNLTVYSLLVINVSPFIAIAALVFGLLSLLLFKPLFYKTRIISHQLMQMTKDIAHYLNENIIGVKSIKSMSLENMVLKASFQYFDDLKNLQLTSGWIASLNQVLFQPVGILFIVGIFAFFYKTEVFNFPSFAIGIYSINKVFSNIQYLQLEIHSWNSFFPPLASIFKFRDDVLRHQEEDLGNKSFSLKDSLEFKEVAFTYDKDGSGAVLSDVSFVVKKGEMAGLIGSSGAGKTTIVDLLLRLFRPLQGKIEMDGLDISKISLRDWRTNIGYVSQDIFLINDTILNNIKFYDDSISFEEAVAAAKSANIYDFVVSLPNQFEAVAGERGMQLSAGQRQRIVLARILARKPKILILDEATSALDNESEALIQKSLEKLRGEVTIIAIAHRLSTVLNFDKLLVLENGKIIEAGVPRELLKDPNSYFYRIYNLKK